VFREDREPRSCKRIESQGARKVKLGGEEWKPGEEMSRRSEHVERSRKPWCEERSERPGCEERKSNRWPECVEGNRRPECEEKR
jgi:hypothetical protein